MRLEAFGSRCRGSLPGATGRRRARHAAAARARPAQPAERARRRRGRPRGRRAVRADRRRRSRSSAAPSGASSCAGEARACMVVDDYGHHPTEIAAVIAAARAGIDRAWSSRCSSRIATRGRETCSTTFGPALGARRRVVLTDIYAAGEAPIPGVTAEALAEAIGARRGAGRARRQALDDLPAAVAALARPGDLVITLGAGSIGTRRRPDPRALGASRRAEGDAPREGQGAGRRNFRRRPKVRPAGRKRGGRERRGCVAGDRRARPAGRRRARRGLSRLAARRVLHASALQVSRIVVHGNVRLSSGEVAGARRRPARHEHPRPRPAPLPARAHGIAVGRRRRAAPRAAVHGGGLRVRAAADGARAGSGSSSTWSTAAGTLIDEFGPQYAEFDLPIIDGLVAAASGGAGDRRRPRASSPRGSSTRSAPRADSRSGSRRSTSATRTTPSSLLRRRSGAAAPRATNVSSSGCSRTSTSRRRCASRCRSIDYVDSAVRRARVRRGRRRADRRADGQ